MPYGQTTVTAQVTAQLPGQGKPQGSIIFHVNNGTTTTDTAGIPLDANSKASLPFTLAPGSYTITASYSGDANFNPNNLGLASPTVTKDGTVTTVATNNANAAFGQPIITATVKPQDTPVSRSGAAHGQRHVHDQRHAGRRRQRGQHDRSHRAAQRRRRGDDADGADARLLHHLCHV